MKLKKLIEESDSLTWKCLGQKCESFFADCTGCSVAAQKKIIRAKINKYWIEQEASK